MAKLIHNKKNILKDMVYATSIGRIARGLMLTGKIGVDRGICMKIPISDSKYNASVTMAFCFLPMDILFVDSEMTVVDKVCLKPWKMSYIPKKPARYVIESSKNKFSKIKIGDKIRIEL